MIVNDDQQDATILAYLFIPNQLYMFRAMYSPIVTPASSNTSGQFHML
jgi:hypothetical protein